jgi:DNA-nicking Smr family endonuclease
MPKNISMGSPPEDDEFREALRGVQPLGESRRVELRRPRPAPYPRQTQLDERAALAESLGPVSLDDALDSGEELSFIRNGYSRDVLRKLRRGHWVVEDHLDLHGMNRLAAAVSVNEFLRRSMARRLRCVRIVHGKGLGSHNREPVLKGMLRKWLPLRQELLAFSQAPSAHGGSGAVLLLLRSAR